MDTVDEVRYEGTVTPEAMANGIRVLQVADGGTPRAWELRSMAVASAAVAFAVFPAPRQPAGTVVLAGLVMLSLFLTFFPIVRELRLARRVGGLVPSTVAVTVTATGLRLRTGTAEDSPESSFAWSHFSTYFEFDSLIVLIGNRQAPSARVVPMGPNAEFVRAAVRAAVPPHAVLQRAAIRAGLAPRA